MEHHSVSIVTLYKQVESSKTFTEQTKQKLLLRLCTHVHSTQLDPVGSYLECYFKMNICTSAVKLPKAWAVEIESVTKNPTLGHCTLQRTSLLSWVCGDSYGGDWNTYEKAAKGNCQALKERPCFKRFFIRIFIVFLSLLSSSVCLLHSSISIRTCTVYPRLCTCADTSTDMHAHSRWWRMMAEAGPVSDLSCNRGNRAPIDPLGERPGISFHTHAHIQ